MPHIYVIDVETTGEGDTLEVIEIGGHCVPDNQPDILNPFPDPVWRGFSSLCQPTRPISAETSAVHHITDWHVRDKPPVQKVVADMLLDFLDDDPIFAAHNAEFEKTALGGLLPDGFSPRWVCTYKLALTLFPSSPTFKNAGLFYHLGIFHGNPVYWSDFFQNNQMHRAWPDAVITSEILKVCLKYLSVEEMIDISSKPPLLAFIPFGRQKGQLWSDADVGFLEWVLDRDFDADVMHTARHYHTKYLIEQKSTQEEIS